MLLRLIVGLVLLGFVYSVVRATLFPKKSLPGGRLEKDELTRLRQLAKHSPRVQEALALRDDIHRVIEEHPSSRGESGAELEARVDAVSRQLLEQTSTRIKVEEALRRFDANTHAEEILESTLERLQSQGEHLERLRRRLEQLEHAEKQIVVELRNVQLALLDAASSKAGLGDERVQEIRVGLAEAAETLRQTTDADEELTRLLRGAETEREG